MFLSIPLKLSLIHIYTTKPSVRVALRNPGFSRILFHSVIQYRILAPRNPPTTHHTTLSLIHISITAGIFGVQAALKGETGKMVSFIRQETSKGVYQMRCGLEDVNEICNEEKTVPLSWISQDGSDVTEDFIHYARPLIQGNVELPMGEDGLPVCVYRK